MDRKGAKEPSAPIDVTNALNALSKTDAMSGFVGLLMAVSNADATLRGGSLAPPTTILSGPRIRPNSAGESLAAEWAALLSFVDRLASLPQSVSIRASALPKDLTVHRGILNVHNGLMLVLSPHKEVTSISQITSIKTFTPILISHGDVRAPTDDLRN